MKMTPISPILLSMLICGFAGVTEAKVLFSGEEKQNNLVSELLEAASISKTGNPLTFTRSSDGWIFISANYKGQGTVRIIDSAEKRGVFQQDLLGRQGRGFSASPFLSAKNRSQNPRCYNVWASYQVSFASHARNDLLSAPGKF